MPRTFSGIGLLALQFMVEKVLPTKLAASC
jgi:hypothetical protein